jgi:hypothetical protein
LPTFFSTTTTTAIGISSCWSRVRRPYPPIVWKDRPTGTKRTQQNKTPHTHKQKTFQYSIKKIREFFPFFFFFHQIFRLFFFVFRRFKSRVAFALIGRTTREKEGEPTEREKQWHANSIKTLWALFLLESLQRVSFVLRQQLQSSTFFGDDDANVWPYVLLLFFLWAGIDLHNGRVAYGLRIGAYRAGQTPLGVFFLFPFCFRPLSLGRRKENKTQGNDRLCTSWESPEGSWLKQPPVAEQRATTTNSLENRKEKRTATTAEEAGNQCQQSCCSNSSSFSNSCAAGWPMNSKKSDAAAAAAAWKWQSLCSSDSRDPFYALTIDLFGNVSDNNNNNR